MQAAPGPVLGASAQTRSDWIEEDVLDRGGQVLVAVHDPRRVAVAEQVTAAFVAPVELQSVDPVQPVHSARHRFDGRFEHEVVVGRHQAVGVDVPFEASDAIGQESEESRAIDAVAEDRLVVDA